MARSNDLEISSRKKESVECAGGEDHAEGGKAMSDDPFVFLREAELACEIVIRDPLKLARVRILALSECAEVLMRESEREADAAREVLNDLPPSTMADAFILEHGMKAKRAATIANMLLELSLEVARVAGIEDTARTHHDAPRQTL